MAPRVLLALLAPPLGAGCSLDCFYPDRLDVVAAEADGSSAFVFLALGHFGGCNNMLEGHALTLGEDGVVDDESEPLAIDADPVSAPAGFVAGYNGGELSCSQCTLSVEFGSEDSSSVGVPRVVTIERPGGEGEYTITLSDGDGAVLASASL